MLTAAYAAVLDEVRGITWPALRRVRSAVPGPHVSVVRGTTAEFIEHRPYHQGDDPKKIDWKLVARTDRVYIRLSQERTILPTMLVLDASASMAFPLETKAKWDVASRIGIGLAAVARHGGDPVGMTIVSGGRSSTVPPRTRRTVLEEMMRALDVMPAGDQALLPATVAAMRGATRVVMITDFLGDADDLVTAGKRFVASGSELHAVHIVDPLELEPDPKLLLVSDPENPLVRRPISPAARAAYVKRFAAWRADLAGRWRRAGANYVMVVPGTEPMRQIVRRIATPPTLSRRRA